MEQQNSLQACVSSGPEAQGTLLATLASFIVIGRPRLLSLLLAPQVVHISQLHRKLHAYEPAGTVQLLLQQHLYPLSLCPHVSSAWNKLMSMPAAGRRQRQHALPHRRPHHCKPPLSAGSGGRRW